MRHHALRRGQRHVHRVGVATEIIARLEHGDVGLVFQGVGHGQAGNARTHDGQFHARLHDGTHGWAFRALSMAESRVLLSGPVMLLYWSMTLPSRPIRYL